MRIMTNLIFSRSSLVSAMALATVIACGGSTSDVTTTDGGGATDGGSSNDSSSNGDGGDASSSDASSSDASSNDSSSSDSSSTDGGVPVNHRPDDAVLHRAGRRHVHHHGPRRVHARQRLHDGHQRALHRRHARRDDLLLLVRRARTTATAAPSSARRQRVHERCRQHVHHGQLPRRRRLRRWKNIARRRTGTSGCGSMSGYYATWLPTNARTTATAPEWARPSCARGRPPPRIGECQQELLCP